MAAIIAGSFGRFLPIVDGAAASPELFVYGTIEGFRHVLAEAAPTIFPGVFTAVIQYAPPMLQPIPAQVVGY